MKKILSVLVLYYLLFPALALAANFNDVVVNEVAWMGTVNSPSDEWIELFNNTGSPINFDGWVLKSENSKLKINLRGTINPDDFYLLERTDDTSVSGAVADQIYTGSLKNTGENLKLYDASGNAVDQINSSSGWFAGNNETKQTMSKIDSVFVGENPDNWRNSLYPAGTPRFKNTVAKKELPTPTPTPTPTSEPQQTAPATEDEKPVATVKPEPEKQAVYPSGIIFNEILPSPQGTDETEEWIEIYNQNNFDIELSDWQVKDSVGSITAYAFPKNSKIQAQGFLVLRRPDTKIVLNNDGDGLNLIQPNGNIIETAAYQKALLNQSYNRISGDWSWSATLTPGKENIISLSESNKSSSSAAKTGAVKKSANDEASSSLDKNFQEEQTANIGEKANSFAEKFYPILIALAVAAVSAALIFGLKKVSAKTGEK